MTKTIVYQCLCEQYNPITAAQSFAKNYFDKPRQVKNIVGVGDKFEFTLYEGVATYEVRVESENGQELFRIYRLDKARQ